MRIRNSLVFGVALALLSATALAGDTDVFEQSKTSFKYCLAKYVAPYPDMPQHRVYKCVDGIQDVTDGHAIDIELGTRTYNRDVRSGDLATDCQNCGKFGGWDAEGTRHVYWVEAPIDYNNRHSFSNYYRFRDGTEPPMASEIDMRKAELRCGGNTGSGTFWAYSFYAGDDIELKGDQRAMKGREALEAQGKTIIASWDVRPPDGAAGPLAAYWKNEGQGTMNCRVEIEPGAKAASITDQRNQVMVWNHSRINVLPGSGKKAAKAAGKKGGAPALKLPWQR